MVFCKSCIEIGSVNLWISFFYPFVLGRDLLVGTTEFGLFVDIHSFAVVVIFEKVSFDRLTTPWTGSLNRCRERDILFQKLQTVRDEAIIIRSEVFRTESAK